MNWPVRRRLLQPSGSRLKCFCFKFLVYVGIVSRVMNEMSPRSDPPGTDATPAQIVSPPASPSKSKPKVKFVEPTYKSTLIYALSYLCVEGAIVVSCSAFFQNVATPPWRLEHDAPWHSTFTRLSIWMNICHGLSHLVNGTFYREFKQPKFKLAWVCLLYTSPSPRDRTRSRMPSSA